MNHCALCGDECGARFGCASCYPHAQYARSVPTLDERARWFHERGTTVAELCDRAGRRGPTIAGRVFLGAIRIIAAVGRGLAKGKR